MTVRGGSVIVAARTRSTLNCLGVIGDPGLLAANRVAHLLGPRHLLLVDLDLFPDAGSLLDLDLLAVDRNFNRAFLERGVARGDVTIQVIDNGNLLRRNMRRKFLTFDELHIQLREEGIERVEDVKAAFIEGDGSVSVIPFGRR